MDAIAPFPTRIQRLKELTRQEREDGFSHVEVACTDMRGRGTMRFRGAKPPPPHRLNVINVAAIDGRESNRFSRNG